MSVRFISEQLDSNVMLFYDNAEIFRSSETEGASEKSHRAAGLAHIPCASTRCLSCCLPRCDAPHVRTSEGWLEILTDLDRRGQSSRDQAHGTVPKSLPVPGVVAIPTPSMCPVSQENLKAVDRQDQIYFQVIILITFFIRFCPRDAPQV